MKGIPVSTSSPPPAMAPDEDGKYLHLVGDKRYALHGEILMLVLVLGFSIFLLLLVALPWLRRRSRSTESQCSWCFLWQKKKPTRLDDDYQASGGIGNVESSSEIDKKFPL